ncbi:hypothetical protein OUO20_03725 [Arthrobacter sp. FX8]|uniref:hypothetical protein n=1 Tax=Arthrobacter sp. FX8 TaxID=2997335 RepID=UPI00227B2CD9|nr:hypothetical protein [Arthrobacter sp. FX8]WAJ34104.1 hypothetical protein OUO20_03725 [Arthrobacter sp. FX8]
MTPITLPLPACPFQNFAAHGRSTVAMLRQTAPAATLGTMPDSPSSPLRPLR